MSFVSNSNFAECALCGYFSAVFVSNKIGNSWNGMVAITIDRKWKIVLLKFWWSNLSF